MSDNIASSLLQISSVAIVSSAVTAAAVVLAIKQKQRHKEELRDEHLFKHPKCCHLGDCPICFLPLPIKQLDGVGKHETLECCSKEICDGCMYVHNHIEIEEKKKLTVSCPMCRTTIPTTLQERLTSMMKRVAVNDPVAMRGVGLHYYGEKDDEKAFEFLSRSAELGDATACDMLARMYIKGEGVEKDYERGDHFLVEASIAGHPRARHHLGLIDYNSKRYDRAVKHWIISASVGLDESIKSLKHAYKEGHVSKDDFAAALRAHQAAADEMKSPQRDVAEAFHRQQERETGEISS